MGTGKRQAVSQQHTAADKQSRPPEPTLLTPVNNVRVSPTMATWCLSRDHLYNGHLLDAPFRLWLILRAFDQNGRGWLPLRAVERVLARKGSRYYIYGRRRLQTVLRRGEGLFWNRVVHHNEVRIRLVSRAKVAAGLECGPLRGQEVSLPIVMLLGSGRGRQADVNAALYACFHTGRNHEERVKPISRYKLLEVAHISKYRQRDYEKRVGIRVQRHIRLLEEYTPYRLARTRIYERRPAYKHVDHRGLAGPAGAAYVAQAAPNSYIPPKAIAAVRSRRQRTINRQLAGPPHDEGRGSGSSKRFRRVFYQNGDSAARAYNRDPSQPVFWPVHLGKRVGLWHSIEPIYELTQM